MRSWLLLSSALLPLLLAGCGEDTTFCEDLAELCAQCDETDPNENGDKQLCLMQVENDDEQSCEVALDIYPACED